MSDSHTITFLLSGISKETYATACWPYKRNEEIDQDGVVTTSYPKKMSSVSPLTKARFKIKPVFAVTRDYTKIIGYQLEINTPACTIGNNVLVENRVYAAALLSKLVLQLWLLKNGCSVAAAQAITLKNAGFDSVSLTFLHELKNHDDAVLANQQLLAHADALKNSKRAPGQRKPVYSVGTSTDMTVYIKHVDYQISSYVKAGPTKKAFAEIRNANVGRQLYAIGEKTLRTEIETHRSWLVKHQRVSPLAWKFSTKLDPHKAGLDEIRQALRLDENLRTKRPKPTSIQKLGPLDQAVLKDHLDGKNTRDHPMLRSKGNQYFSAVKLRILKALRIDIAIPWVEQSNKYCPRLSSILDWRGPYHPPSLLERHSFCKSSIAALKVKLTNLIQREIRSRESSEH
jgi:hypothetical protein